MYLNEPATSLDGLLDVDHILEVTLAASDADNGKATGCCPSFNFTSGCACPPK